jgi:Domain of unknown function (DUF5103)
MNRKLGMRRIILVVFYGFLTPFLFAQIKNVDSVYSETLRSVQMSANGALPVGVPALNLKGGSVALFFDDMDTEFKNFLYSVEHCDRDWKPSKLEKLEYTEGLMEDRIQNFKNSSATNVPYIHYSLVFPNESIRVTKSGNYILKVYEDNSDKTVVLTRRFVVFEQILSAVPEQLTNINPIKYNTHQEMDMTVEAKSFRVQNPINDIRLLVLQNGRWDLKTSLLPPIYTRGETLVFDYQDSISFPAGKEWRYVDLRSTRFRSERVHSLDKGDETWDVTLRNDIDRNREPYIFYPDLNGGYFIENRDFGSDLNALNADYMDTHFTLSKKTELDDEDIYLFGALTDWKIDDRFKMTFNAQQKAYEGDVRLKQGFYNYRYVTVIKGFKDFDESALEGDWFEAENEYTGLIYYRPFGARYDRIIGLSKFKSLRR